MAGSPSADGWRYMSQVGDEDGCSLISVGESKRENWNPLRYGLLRNESDVMLESEPLFVNKEGGKKRMLAARISLWSQPAVCRAKSVWQMLRPRDIRAVTLGCIAGLRRRSRREMTRDIGC